MLYLLLFLMLIIVLVIGYILCRPFINETDSEESAQHLDHAEISYEALQAQIALIESDCQAGIITAEVCQARLQEMKTATQHLPSTHHQVEAELTEKQTISAIREAQNTYTPNNPADGLDYCPQCGQAVFSADKFCIQCGHTLQR